MGVRVRVCVLVSITYDSIFSIVLYSNDNEHYYENSRKLP